MSSSDVGYGSRGNTADGARRNPLNHWRSAIAVDLRSLALFRVAAATLLLWDLLTRLPDLGTHYTDAGVLPRSTLGEVSGPFPAYWPHYYAAAHPFAQGVLFATQIAAAALLLVGWRTRLMTVVSWGLLVGLHHYNDFVLGGGDALLRLMLFWGMFLPLGARASLDAWADPGGAPPSNAHVSLAGFAALAQLGLMYVITALMKNGPAWYDGTALAQALLNDYYVRPLGVWLRGQEALLPAATWATLTLEFIGPVLILSPLWNATLRAATLLAFAAFHAGIWLTMDVAIFSQASLAAWAICVPGAAWDLLRIGSVCPVESSAGRRMLGLPLWLRPKRARLHVPVAAQIVAATSLAYVLVINVSQLPANSYAWARFLDPPAPVKAVFHIVLLDQRWSMFAPEPRREFAWYVVEGERADGSRIDLLREGRPASFEKPASLLEAFPSMRWRIYMTQFFMEDERSVPRLAPLARWFARQWNRRQARQDQVVTLRVYAMIQRIEGGRQSPPARRLLFTYDARRDRGTRPARGG